MLIEVKVPQLSESVAEATLLAWHKNAGDFVKRDENLVDIETDKVVLETPAPDSGVLIKIVKAEGGTVTSNEVIAQIDTEAKPAEGTAKAEKKAPAKSGQEQAPAAKPAEAAAKTQKAVPPKAEEKPAAKTETTGGAPAMPSAQKLAAEKQVNTAAISGT
ncbi:MAG: dihydrolipoamide succinyltransferase, partial [Betaproteobacteria bacterium]|nr:dihydrolipoamide succinyltransferase [Betaproteobacteria bacterium]